MPIDTRIFRVGESDFCGDEILNAGRTHTPARLKAISEAGFTGIWLRGRLRDLAPGTLFKDYVQQVDDRRKSLQTLCQRAQKHQLGIWLFFTEPLGLPCVHPFWQKHPGLKGHRTRIMNEPAEYALCSSTPPVQHYLRDGFRDLFNHAPVAGAILITSSEQVNNCWAHVLSHPSSYPCPEKYWADKCACPRCSSRSPAEVISEIINLIHQGVQASRHPGKVVAWDWSWNMHCPPPYKPISDRIDPKVILMGDFERGLQVRRLGRQRTLEEYSLVCSGPSRRFAAKVKTYGKKRTVFAKLQINTTHELATVANLPLMVSLYRKLKYMHTNSVSGTMACWNFGCFTDTLNVYAFNKFARATKFPDEKRSLTTLAQEYFETDHHQAEKIVQCWYGFQKATQSYPVNGYLFLYWSPINYALAYPLKEKLENKPMGPSWIPHLWGDKLEDSLGEYSLDEMITLLRQLTLAWNKRVWPYKDSLQNCRHTQRAQKELASAALAGCTFRSTYNIYRWYRLTKDGRKPGHPEKIEIIRNEIENLQQALTYIPQDNRSGYHQEPHLYLYDEHTIRGKLAQLKTYQQHHTPPY